MEIEDIIVSCGTCLEMLNKYNIENIFPGTAITDINEFIARESIYQKKSSNALLYHEPCHSPLKSMGADKTFIAIYGNKPLSAPNCCGEGGTMSMSTPHISNSLRGRKRDNFLSILNRKESATVLTSCPSCVQGLSKINNRISVQGKHLAVFLAESFLGKNWKRDFIKSVNKNDGVERIVL